MFNEGIHDVSFAVCNTDKQSLDDSPVPVHVPLGVLGAGNKPEVARKKAEEHIEDIKNMLNDGTQMAFITAGMGGGTGTGAGPVVARISKEMGILTVGIVTIPFKWEGVRKIDQALDGVEEMSKNVDAMLVINNERLIDVYSDYSLLNAFQKADETLSVAAKGISEIITLHGIINLDFNDVNTVLKDGGVAIMSTGYGEGEGRVKKAIDDALNSPLLNDNDIYNSKKILLSISFSSTSTAGDGNSKTENKGLMVDEMNEITSFMNKFNSNYETKWGIFLDPELGDKVKVTILASGFGMESIERMQKSNGVGYKDDEQKLEQTKRIGRIDKYYGNNNHRHKNVPNIFYFNIDDLENDEVISEVESTPTYLRTKAKVEEIKNLSRGNIEESRPQQRDRRGDHIEGTISFGAS